ncbi:hypothetical protein BC830DRAFT_1088186 [Chytriomyces sp. MP71]|nr:hypothetical protein BC830DRAFT_1088186 [Chytriomyces sp. MP71]
MQWAMFALPNWRGDQYQTAGLFQVCGTVDLQFNPTFADAGGAGNLTIKATHEYRCQSVETYVNNFLDMVKPDPNHPQPSDRWYKSAVGALPHIQTSRWLEAAGTALDMVFGVGTILLIVRPHPNRKVETRNAAVTYAGILIMPWFPVFDILISFDFWDRIGVGYFESLTFNSGGFSNYTKAGAVVSLFTSWFDLVVQLWFLTWGLQRMFRANKKRGAVSELGEEKDIPLQQV